MKTVDDVEGENNEMQTIGNKRDITRSDDWRQCQLLITINHNWIYHYPNCVR